MFFLGFFFCRQLLMGCMSLAWLIVSNRDHKVPPVVLLSICAVSARFSTHPQFSTTPSFRRGENWAATARGICLHHHDTPHLSIVTAQVLLSLHEFGSCRGERAWALAGQAIRMAYALGLHVESPTRGVEEEIKTRAMWSCVVLDRLMTVDQRPSMVDSSVVSQLALPLSDSALDELVVGGQPSTCRDHDAMAIVMRLLSMPFEPRDDASTDTSVLKDMTALPDHLTYSHDNMNAQAAQGTVSQYLLLHVMRQHTILQKTLGCA